MTAYDERVIDGKLKPFVELTGSFASQSVKEQVSSLFHYGSCADTEMLSDLALHNMKGGTSGERVSETP